MKRLLNTIACLLLVTVFATSCAQNFKKDQASASRTSIEDAHGIKLPASSSGFQQITSGDNTNTDGGILSLVEINSEDLDSFLSQLTVNSVRFPIKKNNPTPLENGWNVWPENAETFVPGNEDFNRIKRSWTGNAIPMKMLSCTSTKGDWLHIEVWSLANGILLKMYTDWN